MMNEVLSSFFKPQYSNIQNCGMSTLSEKILKLREFGIPDRSEKYLEQLLSRCGYNVDAAINRYFEIELSQNTADNLTDKVGNPKKLAYIPPNCRSFCLYLKWFAVKLIVHP